MTTQPLASETEAKTKRIRSVAYPSFTIGDCIALTSQIYKFFGDSTYTSRAALSKRLTIRESNLQRQVSSCVQYGLLVVKPKEGYKPGEPFLKLYDPLPDENIGGVFISLFLKPELYKSIVERFNGKLLPQEEGLASILYRKQKVAEKVSSFVAKIFIESANECGFLKNRGILKV